MCASRLNWERRRNGGTFGDGNNTIDVISRKWQAYGLNSEIIFRSTNFRRVPCNLSIKLFLVFFVCLALSCYCLWIQIANSATMTQLYFLQLYRK